MPLPHFTLIGATLCRWHPRPDRIRIDGSCAIEMQEGRTSEEKRNMVDTVRAALSDALQAPRADPTVRLAKYRPDEFSLPHPDHHSDRFTLIEATTFKGRSLDTKRRLYTAIVDRLSPWGFRAHAKDVLIVRHEPPMENWAVNGGFLANEVDLGFTVDI